MMNIYHTNAAPALMLGWKRDGGGTGVDWEDEFSFNIFGKLWFLTHDTILSLNRNAISLNFDTMVYITRSK